MYVDRSNYFVVFQNITLIYDLICVHDNVLYDTKYVYDRSFYGNGSNYFVPYQIISLIYNIICVHDNVLNDPKYFIVKFFMFMNQIILSHINIQVSFIILFVSMIMSFMVQYIFMIKFFRVMDQIILSHIKLQASFMILFVSMIMSLMIQNNVIDEIKEACDMELYCPISYLQNAPNHIIYLILWT